MCAIQNEFIEEKDGLQGLENDKKEKKQITKSYFETQIKKVASFFISIPNPMENQQ